MNNSIKKILKLIKDNPNLPVVPAIKGEDVYNIDNDYGANLAKISKIEVDYYLFDREYESWFAGKSNIFDYIYDNYIYSVDTKYAPFSKTNKERTLNKFKELEEIGIIKRGIIIYIDNFDGEI